jgi:serine/threonine-protein kinase
MATGSVPFKEGNIPYHHVHTPSPDIREIRADIPETLASVVNRCLMKDPDQRYQSAREILDDLRSSLSQSATRTQR